MSASVVVSDAGPLIALGRADLLDILPAVFVEIHIPQAVADETTANLAWPAASRIAAFIQQHAHVHRDTDDHIYRTTVMHLDEGEARAISLAASLGCGLLMDERRGREAATRIGLPLIGVVGLLLKAKQKGVLDAIAPHLMMIRGNGYRLSQHLIDRALVLAGEA